MKPSVRVLLLLWLIASILVPIDSVRASFAGRPGDIAFGRSGERPGIRVMRRDGSNVRRLTRGFDSFPAWSPDGGRVAFVRYTSTALIMVMNADGSARSVISSPPDEQGCGYQLPHWSYDGLFLVYADDCFDRDPRVAQLRIVTADGNSELDLTDYSALNNFGSQPWSPNLEESLRLTFTSNADGPDQEVYVMNSDGTERSMLTDDEVDQFEAQWSPRGDLIAFTTQEPMGTEAVKGYLEVIDPQGQSRRVLAESRYDLGEPLWSPDGNSIAFTRFTLSGRPTLYVISTAGEETKIGRDLFSDAASWSADSKSLLISDDGDVIRIRVTDGLTTRLTSGGAFDYGIDQEAR